MNTNNMRMLRNEKKLKQEDIAKILNVSRQAYAYWENGDRTPDVDSIIKLAEFYNVSLDFIAGTTDVRINYKLDTDLEKYVDYCINGYNEFLRKASK